MCSIHIQLHGLKEQTSVSRDRGAGVGAGTAKSSAAKSLPPRPAPRDPTHGSPPGSPPLGFSRHEHWSGLPFPSPEDLPDPGMEPRSPALQADALPSELPLESKSEVK